MEAATVGNAPRTVASWGKRKPHDIVLPSGMEVTIEIPNLPKIIKGGDLPNHLISAAVQQVNAQKVTEEMIKSQWDYYKFLLLVAVKDPQITEDDLDSDVIPYEDIEMLVEIATRQRDMDATYQHIGGLDKLEAFRRARGIPDGDAALEGI